MKEGTVVALPRPGASVTDDPLLAVLREGARRMLMQAIEAEVETFLTAHGSLVDEQGRRRLVRNGHAPERQIQTGIGPLEVRRPKVRDRGGAAGGKPILCAVIASTCMENPSPPDRGAYQRRNGVPLWPFACRRPTPCEEERTPTQRYAANIPFLKWGKCSFAATAMAVGGAQPHAQDRQADLGSHRLMAMAAGALPRRQPLFNNAALVGTLPGSLGVGASLPTE